MTAFIPPAVPVKVTNGYRATGALPSVKPAELTPAAYPAALPKSFGFEKMIGNMNTYKVAAREGADATKTFRATGSLEQAVVAASLLAKKLPDGTVNNTQSYAVVAAGDDLFVTPLWDKNASRDGTTIGVNIDWRNEGGANDNRGMASRATDPIYLAAVGRDRWIDVRGTVKPAR